MYKIFKEPFIQFILLGALLFIGHGVWSSQARGNDVIHVTADTVERLKTIYAGEQRREPDDDDLKALIHSHVEEEALAREAERLGLGEDDTIIRRRLAQKMRFMTENLGKPDLPSESTLKDWYSQKLSLFTEPERLSFQHIYFSPDDKTDIQARASQALSEARADADWKTLGNPFIMSRNLTRVTQVDIARGYGKDFANSVMKLPEGEWSDPIASAYGLHIVRVSERQSEAQPSFEDARQTIEARWGEEAQREKNAQAIEKITNSYTVVIDGQK